MFVPSNMNTILEPRFGGFLFLFFHLSLLSYTHLHFLQAFFLSFLFVLPRVFVSMSVCVVSFYIAYSSLLLFLISSLSPCYHACLVSHLCLRYSEYSCSLFLFSAFLCRCVFISLHAFIPLSVCLSVCTLNNLLPFIIFVPVCLFFSSVHLSVFLLFYHLAILPPVSLFVCLSAAIFLSTYIPTLFTLCLLSYLSVPPPVCLSI